MMIALDDAAGAAAYIKECSESCPTLIMRLTMRSGQCKDYIQLLMLQGAKVQKDT